MFVKVFFSGSHRTVRNDLALKFAALLPEPATSSTFPVCSRAAWMVLMRYLSGTLTTSQWPFAALYSGLLISYWWYCSEAKP